MMDRTNRPITSAKNIDSLESIRRRYILSLSLEHVTFDDVRAVKGSRRTEHFASMYAIMMDLLDRFYPERRITVLSTYPRSITPAVKAMLRRKNRLMLAGRTEEAGALARRNRAVISRQNSSWLRKINARKIARNAWIKVREVIGGKTRREHSDIAGITAQLRPQFRKTDTIRRRC